MSEQEAKHVAGFPGCALCRGSGRTADGRPCVTCAAIMSAISSPTSVGPWNAPGEATDLSKGTFDSVDELRRLRADSRAFCEAQAQRARQTAREFYAKAEALGLADFRPPSIHKVEDHLHEQAFRADGLCVFRDGDMRNYYAVGKPSVTADYLMDILEDRNPPYFGFEEFRSLSQSRERPYSRRLWVEAEVNGIIKQFNKWLRGN